MQGYSSNFSKLVRQCRWEAGGSLLSGRERGTDPGLPKGMKKGSSLIESVGDLGGGGRCGKVEGRDDVLDARPLLGTDLGTRPEQTLARRLGDRHD